MDNHNVVGSRGLEGLYYTCSVRAIDSMDCRLNHSFIQLVSKR